MRVYVDPQDGVHMLYRGLEGTTRPMVHLHSTDRGKTFAYRLFDPWDIQACPMSLVSMAYDANGTAWIANEWGVLDTIASAITESGMGVRNSPRW